MIHMSLSFSFILKAAMRPKKLMSAATKIAVALKLQTEGKSTATHGDSR